MYEPRYIQYLNLPPIPQYLVDQFDCNPEMHRQSQTSQVYGPYIWSNHGTDAINQWCQENICAEMYFACQIITGDLATHKDIGTKIKLTYIVSNGGDNVVTNFYDDDQTTLLASYVIESNRWHILKADTYHQVSNIQPDQIRISITGRIF
jgi:hypothetical protein